MDFEVRSRELEDLGINISENDIEDFVSVAEQEVYSLEEEIKGLTNMCIENHCEYFSQAVYNYKSFLEGQIKFIQDETKSVQERMEQILLQNACRY